VNADKNEFYEILHMLDKISDIFISEVNNLKKKLKFYELKPELRSCTLKFYEETLVPLFKEKSVISLLDIINRTKRKKCTIQTYLSELYRYKFINRIRNDQGDKRTKLFEKMI